MRNKAGPAHLLPSTQVAYLYRIETYYGADPDGPVDHHGEQKDLG